MTLAADGLFARLRHESGRFVMGTGTVIESASSEAERTRQVEEAVHSVRMEGLDLTLAGAADAEEYIAGRMSLDEYGRRTRDRYGVPHEVG
jgi:hypothetical protein